MSNRTRTSGFTSGLTGGVTGGYSSSETDFSNKIKMTLQAAESPVLYGPRSDQWSRLTDYGIQLNEDELPKDPRHWTREHVLLWLRLVCLQHGLPEVPPSRFLMNGKALCLMSPNMFLCRVPLGGKLLYKDFQLRLCAALYSSASS